MLLACSWDTLLVLYVTASLFHTTICLGLGRGGSWLGNQSVLTREEFAAIILGTIFLFIGVGACCLAVVRSGSTRRILSWFGILAGLYGVRLFAEVPAAFSLLAGSFSDIAPQLVWVIIYVLPIPALFFWAELSLGNLRRFLHILVVAASVIAVVGVSTVLLHKSPARFMPYFRVQVICGLLGVAVANVVPRIGNRYLVIRSWVSAVGTLLFAAAVIYENSRTFLNLREYPFHSFESVAFALFLFSQGWVATEKVVADEYRLLSIENELTMAREIQTSILPRSNPEVTNLRIAAAYHPMTAVAGDFYDFIPVDQHHIGVLVADVSGHGVPAALVAAMIKMAVQSIVPCVHSPGDVLQGLNRMLSGQAPDQFVTAAYLFIDTQNYRVRYSAAGHPPLLLSRAGVLQRIESNGLVFGVTAQLDYPVRDIPICPGDRLLLYTDGVIEPENAKGKPFGESQLEKVVLGAKMCSPAEFTDRLLAEIRAWHPTSVAQQDDITVVVIDVC
jgi:phosphoserine phosphatase RsbU/P